MDLLGRMHKMLKEFVESERGKGWTGIESLAQEPGSPPRFTYELTNGSIVVETRITLPRGASVTFSFDKDFLPSIREMVKTELRNRSDSIISMAVLEKLNWDGSNPYQPVAWGLKCVYIASFDVGYGWEIFAVPRNPPGAP